MKFMSILHINHSPVYIVNKLSVEAQHMYIGTLNFQNKMFPLEILLYEALRLYEIALLNLIISLNIHFPLPSLFAWKTSTHPLSLLWEPFPNIAPPYTGSCCTLLEYVQCMHSHIWHWILWEQICLFCLLLISLYSTASGIKKGIKKYYWINKTLNVILPPRKEYPQITFVRK